MKVYFLDKNIHLNWNMLKIRKHFYQKIVKKKKEVKSIYFFIIIIIIIIKYA